MTWDDLLPQGPTEKLFYILDGIGIGSLGMAYVSTTGFLEHYIMVMTALTITITVIVKVYNLLTTNKKNKKI